MLAALAEATERIEVGTLVTPILFRNPALLAKMATHVDEISGGWLNLGLGAGWNTHDFDAFSYPFDHPAESAKDYEFSSTGGKNGHFADI